MKTYLSKEDSLILKGIAVVMIIFVHLNWSKMDDFLYIGGKPFMQMISGISAPVEIFTFLGGVGLSFKYNANKDNHRISRIFKLYIHMWVVMLFFVPMAYLLSDTRCYPSSIENFIENVTGLYCTWNGTYWFVLPYAILSLSSRWTFKHLERLRMRWIMFASFLMYFTAYFMRWRYANAEVYILHNGMLSLPVNVMILQFPFIIGYGTMRCNIIRKTNLILKSRWVYTLALLLIIIGKMFFLKTGFFFVEVYAAMFAIFFINIPRIPFIDKIFAFLGRHSLNIWYLHAWFVMVLLAPYVYKLNYSIIVLAAVILISILCSYIINAICEPIMRFVFPKLYHP